MNQQTAVLYLCSAIPFSEDGDALNRQEQALSEFARQVGYQVTQVYRDVGSGYDENRTGLRALLADAEAGQFDTIIVRDYASLSRDYRLTRQIEQTLIECEIAVLTP